MFSIITRYRLLTHFNNQHINLSLVEYVEAIKMITVWHVISVTNFDYLRLLAENFLTDTQTDCIGRKKSRFCSLVGAV